MGLPRLDQILLYDLGFRSRSLTETAPRPLCCTCSASKAFVPRLRSNPVDKVANSHSEPHRARRSPLNCYECPTCHLTESATTDDYTILLLSGGENYLKSYLDLYPSPVLVIVQGFLECRDEANQGGHWSSVLHARFSFPDCRNLVGGYLNSGDWGLLLRRRITCQVARAKGSLQIVAACIGGEIEHFAGKV